MKTIKAIPLFCLAALLISPLANSYAQPPPPRSPGLTNTIAQLNEADYNWSLD